MSGARAKLFSHGGSQAVRLPKAFRFTGSEVAIRREGSRVILEPAEFDWDALWAEIDANGGRDFPDPPPQPPVTSRWRLD
jgi:antitoxin VapB